MKSPWTYFILMIWGISLAALIKTTLIPQIDAVSWDTFSVGAAITVNEDRVGAKVTLKEAIHGTDGVLYRYIVKTDCPSWDYETRYAVTSPIIWATDETAAVEVLIYDAQVRYEGTAYSNGTYYTIPLFNGLASEEISVEEWEQRLVKQAYTAYVAASESSDGKTLYTIFVIGIPIVWALWEPLCRRYTTRRKKQSAADILTCVRDSQPSDE